MWIAGRPPLCIVRDETREMEERRREERGTRRPPCAQQPQQAAVKEARNQYRCCDVRLLVGFCCWLLFCLPLYARATPKEQTPLTHQLGSLEAGDAPAPLAALLIGYKRTWIPNKKDRRHSDIPFCVGWRMKAQSGVFWALPPIDPRRTKIALFRLDHSLCIARSSPDGCVIRCEPPMRSSSFSSGLGGSGTHAPRPSFWGPRSIGILIQLLQSRPERADIGLGVVDLACLRSIFRSIQTPPAAAAKKEIQSGRRHHRSRPDVGLGSKPMLQ